MTRPGPPHESVVRTGRGGGGDSAEWRMRGREAGAGSPEGRPIRPLPGAAGPLGVGPEACGAAVTQPAAFSAGSRGRASPAPALCPCLRHPAAPCRSASHPRHRGTSLGAAGAAAVPSPCHPPPSPPPLPARCARTAPFPRCPRARGPRRPSFSRARLRPETPRQPTHPRGLGVPPSDLALRNQTKTLIPSFPRAVGTSPVRTWSFLNVVWGLGAPAAVGVELAASRDRPSIPPKLCE